MRKLTVLSLAGLLILAFSAVGYAQAPKLEFRASGFIDVQTFIGEGVPAYSGTGAPAGTWGYVNPDYAKDAVGNVVTRGNTAPGASILGNGLPATNGWNRTRSNWESRAHLKFDAVMGPNLSGTIYFEIDSVRWGSTFNTTANTREANNFGAWTTDRTAVEVKNIYIDVGLPYFGVPWPITVRLGAQPLGIRPHVLLYSDGTGITAGIKIDPVLIMPIYAKALEGVDFSDDDADIWGLHANAKLGTFTLGAYGLTYRMNTYPFYVVTAPLLSNAGQVQGFSGIAIQAPGTFKSHMWWLGAYADGKAGPVNLNFDFVYDYGSVDERQVRDIGLPLFGLNIPNVKYEGWMARAKVDFPWEKFNFGAVGMYATGSDTRRTSTSGLPGTSVAAANVGSPGPNTPAITRRVTSYVVPPGSENGAGAAGESVVVYNMEPGATGGYGIAANANYAAMSRGDFGGTWFAKLYASMKLAPWYKLTVQGLYIGDTTTNGDTFGNSVKYLQTKVTPTGGPAPTMLRDNNNIGWEFDLLNEIQIYNNLRLFVGGGYLFAGDALDVSTGHNSTFPSIAGSVPGNRKADNPWAVRTRLMYTF